MHLARGRYEPWVRTFRVGCLLCSNCCCVCLRVHSVTYVVLTWVHVLVLWGVHGYGTLPMLYVGF
ncbi:hypothetical protein C0J52_04687 [Blattella germanica]|nr:hypothetical protein C0J52_04687 [Blattella germanica]